MGFGTLFIGYFLLLNVVNYGFTDMIAALIMLLGLYKLSKINRYLSASVWICLAFALLGAFEMYAVVANMFLPGTISSSVFGYLSMARFAVIGSLSIVIMLGLRDVAIEVELEEVPVKCLSRIILTGIIYTLGLVLELPFFSSINGSLPYILAAAVILGQLFVLVLNLIVIYNCHMKICMPEDNIAKPPPAVKKSRFEFVNQYRERKAEKTRAEAEYRLDKLQKRIEKKKGGKGK